MSTLLEGWVREINEKLGTSFDVGEDGRLGVAFGNGVNAGVEIASEGDHYTIYCPIMVLDAPQDLGVVLAALKMNLYQIETYGGVLGLDTFLGALVYSVRHPLAGSEAETLAGHLDRFSVAAEGIRMRLKERGGEEFDSLDWTRSDLAALVDEPGDEETIGEDSSSTAGAAESAPHAGTHLIRA